MQSEFKFEFESPYVYYIKQLRKESRKCKSCRDDLGTCACSKYINFAAKMQKSNLPFKFKDALFENYAYINNNKIRIEITRLTKYINEIKKMFAISKGLVLQGDIGVGKTYLACAILKQILLQNINGYYLLMEEVLKNIRKGYNSPKEARYWDDLLCNISFLIIDNIGSEYDSQRGFVAAQLENILRQRDYNGKPTIIVTDLTKKKLKHQYGHRIASMLHGNCLCVSIFSTQINQIEDIRNKEYRQTITLFNE